MNENNKAIQNISVTEDHIVKLKRMNKVILSVTYM